MSKMKPYKLKHKPTGLYYQPIRGYGSNLSKLGKIYQTRLHGLSQAFKYAKLFPDRKSSQIFNVHAEEWSRVYKNTKNILDWNHLCRSPIRAETKITDWEIEEL